MEELAVAVAAASELRPAAMRESSFIVEGSVRGVAGSSCALGRVWWS